MNCPSGPSSRPHASCMFCWSRWKYAGLPGFGPLPSADAGVAASIAEASVANATKRVAVVRIRGIGPECSLRCPPSHPGDHPGRLEGGAEPRDDGGHPGPPRDPQLTELVGDGVLPEVDPRSAEPSVREALRSPRRPPEGSVEVRVGRERRLDEREDPPPR